MKKILALMLGLLLFSCAGSAEELMERRGNALWAYTAEDAGATLTGYFGSETDVVVPDAMDGHPVTAIGEECFRGGSLVTVSVPASVAHIGAYAFADCPALTAAFLHSASLEVDGGAFSGCGRLAVVLMEDDDALLSGDAFSGCGLLRLIVGGAGSEAEELAAALGVPYARLNGTEAAVPPENAEAPEATASPEESSPDAEEQPIPVCQWISRFEDGVRAQVTAQGSAGLRPKPSKEEPYFARVPSGAAVEVLSIEENGWLHVLTGEGKEGYISGKLAEIDWETLLPYYSSFVRIRGKGNANVHRFPDVGALDLARVPVGKVYPLMGVARNGWFKILLYDGYTMGYVSDSMAEYIGADWQAN